MTTERFDTVIIGGGQAGLATGYHLTKMGRSFVIVDSNERIGDSWRKRWDSLRVFTPAKYSSLPGMPIAAPKYSFPTKDEMGDYLESYASRFDMPTRTGVRIDRLTSNGNGFVLTSGSRRYEATNVVVASGANQTARTPDFAPDLDPDILQLHSSAYRSPAQLQDGPVLVVGLGNSGAEIAFEVSRSHQTYVSGKPAGEIPVPHSSKRMRVVFEVVRFAGHHVLCLANPIGRKARAGFVSKATPLIRVKTDDLGAAGIELVGRTTAVVDGRPALDEGRVLDVANVIWCTGFRHSFDWIDVDAFDDAGHPVHERGVALKTPGLYFMGLEFQYAASSDILLGVGRDAAFIARHIASRSVASGEGRIAAHA